MRLHFKWIGAQETHSHRPPLWSSPFTGNWSTSRGWTNGKIQHLTPTDLGQPILLWVKRWTPYSFLVNMGRIMNLCLTLNHLNSYEKDSTRTPPRVRLLVQTPVFMSNFLIFDRAWLSCILKFSDEVLSECIFHNNSLFDCFCQHHQFCMSNNHQQCSSSIPTFCRFQENIPIIWYESHWWLVGGFTNLKIWII
jgi:hypothetical protein